MQQTPNKPFNPTAREDARSGLTATLGFMEASLRTFSIRDIALRAVGRNLTNFQKLEHCIKALIRVDRVAGPMSALNGRVAKRISKASEYTLGKAVQEWLRISTSDQTSRPQTQDLFEPWISLSIELPIDSEGLVAHSEALNSLASERNDLVHQNLANFDFESEAECKKLVAALDSQNQRILGQLAFLAPAIKALAELNEWAMNLQTQEELFNAATFISTDET
jgi:hypothetical protein